MLDATKVAESLHLSPKTVAIKEALMQVVKMAYCVYTKHYRNLDEMHGL